MKILILTLFFNFLNPNISDISVVQLPFYNPLHYECGNRGGTVTEDKDIKLSLNYKYKYLFLKLEVDTSNCKNTVRYIIKNPSGTIMDEGEIESSGNPFMIEKCYKKQITSNNPWCIEFKGILKGDSLKYELDYRAKNLKLAYPNEEHESY
jgi:hypothetical protein